MRSKEIETLHRINDVLQLLFEKISNNSTNPFEILDALDETIELVQEIAEIIPHDSFYRRVPEEHLVGLKKLRDEVVSGL
jgi:hypothetical protein